MTDTVRTDTAAELKSYIERIERLAVERRELGDEQRALFAEARSKGFDAKAMRKIIKRREKDPGELAEEESILDTYMHALGMLPENPLHLQVAKLGKDGLGREQVVAAIKELIPPNGEAILTIGGDPLRIWRTEQGEVFAGAYVPPLLDEWMKKRGKK